LRTPLDRQQRDFGSFVQSCSLWGVFGDKEFVRVMKQSKGNAQMHYARELLINLPRLLQKVGMNV